MKTVSARWPLFIAMILTVVYMLVDSFVIHQLLPSGTKVVLALAYLSLGGLIGLIVNYFLCQTPAIGKIIDPKFSSVKNVSSKTHKIAFFSGLFAAIATGIYLYSFTKIDPGLVIPLTSLSVVFIMLGEVLNGREKLSRIFWPLMLVVSGVIISSSHILFSNWVAVSGVLGLILIGKNLATAISEVVSKGGIDASDAVSFSFWRFFWLAICGIVIAFTLSTALGYLGEFLTVLGTLVLSWKFLLVVFVNMFIVFFGNGFSSRATGIENATKQNVVMTGRIVLSVFLTWLAVQILPGYFTISMITGTDTIDWVLRFFGAGVLASGIYLLGKRQEK